MRKEVFVNEGGINGSPNGRFDTESEDFQVLKAKILEQASKMTLQQRVKVRLTGVKFRMVDYLADESLLLPNDAPTLLSECIAAIEVRQKNFAVYIGLKPSNLSAILKGHRSISPSFALKLEQIFDIPATLWLSVQNKNELERLRQMRNEFSPSLTLGEFFANAGEVKPLPPSKTKKHEPTRKTAGR